MKVLLLFLFSTSVFAANLQKGTFTSSSGSRDYYFYVPANLNQEPRPMVVALHGCTQTALEFSAQSGFTDLAEKYGFIVVYPEQASANNIFKCWNWFKPENQLRNGGEVAIITGLTTKLARENNVDSDRLFIVGLSAGAATAANVFACHSDLFSGVGVHSGVEYHAATTDTEAQQAMKNGSSQNLSESALAAIKCGGPQARMGRVVIVHGSEDNVVNPVNAGRVATQFTKIHDLLDDGIENGTHSLSVITSKAGLVPNGYRYQIDNYGSSAGTEWISNVTVFGMKHAWSGAHSKGQYADIKGPDAAEIIWNFLTK